MCKKRKNFLGQTFIEYTLVLGVVAAALVALTPMIKRGVQAMVKLTADQIGNQVNAEQRNLEAGYLDASETSSKVDISKRIKEDSGETEYSFSGPGTATNSTTATHLGYQER